MADTTHLVLPLLAAAQAQKHVTHNDALQRLDAIVQLSVKDRDLTSPPDSPSDGDRYIPASGASGDWSGWDLNVAWYVDGVWTKLVPREGWRVWVDDEDLLLVWDGSDWVSVTAANVAFTPAGDIEAEDVQAALEELDDGKLAKASNLSDVANVRTAAANLGAWHVLDADAAGVSHTGDTNETALATITVPGGAMGANGVLRVTIAGTTNNSGNNKTWRLRFGGAAGTEYLNRTASGATILSCFQRHIANAGAEDSQTGFFSATTGHSYQVVGGSEVTSSEDTSADVDLVITGELADGGDTITLKGYIVELFHQA